MHSLRLSFDRGTLRLEGDAAERVSGAVWDGRVAGWRAPAHRYAAIVGQTKAAAWDLQNDVEPGLARPVAGWTMPELRAYQRDALGVWRAFGARGIVAMPTGSGKTVLAVAAMADAKVRSLVLCPTRALLEQWERQIARWYAGPVGVVGDGATRVEDVTVMTFESAYRRLDALGDRFGLLVVDEAHHFGGGVRAEALEMCAAPMRLGLTATAPDAGSAAEACLQDLVGPLVCEVGVGDLLGVHLAELEVVRLYVGLDDARCHRPFAELRAAFVRANPEADWVSLHRALGRSAAGRDALAGWRRAVRIASFPRAKQALVGSLLSRHRGEKTLVFTASTDDAYAIGAQQLVPVLTADTRRRERAELLDGFREGRYRVLASARVLNEGLDVPDARVAIVVAGHLGAREHAQRIGRVLRPSPGKVALVYELVTRGTLDDGRSRHRWRRLAGVVAAGR
jgi:superfamily II DNA or RNA helicase